MVESSAVAFSNWVNSFTSGGIEAMNVCGSMTLTQSANPESPSERAASNCPFDTDASPPRRISIMNAALLRVKATIPAVIGPILRP